MNKSFHSARPASLFIDMAENEDHPEFYTLAGKAPQSQPYSQPLSDEEEEHDGEQEPSSMEEEEGENEGEGSPLPGSRVRPFHVEDEEEAEAQEALHALGKKRGRAEPEIDLHAYFAQFPGISIAHKVAICTSYATHLRRLQSAKVNGVAVKKISVRAVKK